MKLLTLSSLDNVALDTTEVARDVVNEVILLSIIENLFPKRTRLLEINYA